MQEKFNQLREKHPVFSYDRYEIENQAEKLVITYYFSLGGFVTFQPRWEFVKKHKDVDYEREETVNRLAFQLGLVELISYWKCACSPLVQIKAGFIDEEQIRWWKQQYFLGLGEFFYTNRIETTIEDFMRVEVIPGQSDSSYNVTDYPKSGCLIPVGGGKDSIVSMELLADRRSSNLCYMINYRETSVKCAKLAGYEDEEILIEKRSLDTRLLSLNKEGYLNGHTPFSAIVAFSSVLAAYLFDKEYVVLSNESSANESTVEGTEVNHQYSKSYKFELDFINYEKKYVGSGVHYFSLLRPFSEFQIAGFFAKQEKYYKVFRSCNVGSKADVWCGACPKCLFVYIILSPFIALDKLPEIFGRDMLNDESLIPIFNKLIGAEPEKPFECVGTCDEVNTAINMVIKEYEAGNRELPKLYRYYKNKRQYALYSSQNDNPYLNYYNVENSVPIEFISRIKNLMLN
jgi:hypothetical protein